MGENKTNNKSGKFLEFILKYAIYLIFIIVFIVLAITSPYFFTWGNLKNVLIQSSIIGTIAIGMTFVIIAQGIDVSVGAVLAIASAGGVGIIKFMGAPWWLGILMMVFVGIIFGIINGYSVAYIKMPAFLVTLATMGIARGFTLVLSGGRSWYDLPPQFSALIQSTIGPIPLLVIIVGILYIIAHFILNNTVYGRHVFAVGGNKEAARVLGIKVNIIIMSTFILSGLFTGIGAILQTGRLNSFWASMGTGFEFKAIASVVIGGTRLTGGIGSLGGTLIGVLLLGIISNALNLWGVPANWQEIARGLIIFMAIMFDALHTNYIIKT